MSRTVTLALVAAITIAPVSALAQSRVVTADWLVGNWSDTPDCRETVNFRPGGVADVGGSPISWRMEGTTIVMAGPGGESRQEVVALDNDRVRNQENVISYRCRGGPVTREWLIGTWSDNPDCSKPFALNPDGSAVIEEGTLRWRQQGSSIVLITPTAEVPIPIERVSDSQMVRVDNRVPSYRC